LNPSAEPAGVRMPSDLARAALDPVRIEAQIIVGKQQGITATICNRSIAGG